MYCGVDPQLQLPLIEDEDVRRSAPQEAERQGAGMTAQTAAELLSAVEAAVADANKHFDALVTEHSSHKDKLNHRRNCQLEKRDAVLQRSMDHGISESEATSNWKANACASGNKVVQKNK
jgi:hypothetical protein